MLRNHIFQGDVRCVEDIQLFKHVVAVVNIRHDGRIGVGEVGEPIVGDLDDTAEPMFLEFSNSISVSHGGGNPDGKIAFGVHAVLEIVVDGGTGLLDQKVGCVNCGVVCLWCGRVERVERKESVIEPGLVLET